jgi:hypothetical protein
MRLLQFSKMRCKLPRLLLLRYKLAYWVRKALVGQAAKTLLLSKYQQYNQVQQQLLQAQQAAVV